MHTTRLTTRNNRHLIHFTTLYRSNGICHYFISVSNPRRKSDTGQEKGKPSLIYRKTYTTLPRARMRCKIPDHRSNEHVDGIKRVSGCLNLYSATKYVQCSSISEVGPICSEGSHFRHLVLMLTVE